MDIGGTIHLTSAGDRIFVALSDKCRVGMTQVVFIGELHSGWAKVMGPGNGQRSWNQRKSAYGQSDWNTQSPASVAGGRDGRAPLAVSETKWKADLLQTTLLIA
jgi:hypothetical protein